MVLDFEGKISKGACGLASLEAQLAFGLPKAKLKQRINLLPLLEQRMSSSRLMRKQCGSGEEKKREEDESRRTDSEK